MAYIINDDCIACGTCIDECPTASITEGEIYVISPETCIDCGACADVCPTGVIAPAEQSFQKTELSRTRILSTDSQ